MPRSPVSHSMVVRLKFLRPGSPRKAAAVEPFSSALLGALNEMTRRREIVWRHVECKGGFVNGLTSVCHAPLHKINLRSLCNSIDAQIFPWYPKLSRAEFKTPGRLPGARAALPPARPRARAGGVGSGRFWRISLELHEQARCQGPGLNSGAVPGGARA